MTLSARRRSAAIRQARRRLEAAHGEVRLSLVVNEAAFVSAMVRAGRLSPEEAQRPAMLEKALADLVAELLARNKGADLMTAAYTQRDGLKEQGR
jgi:hypothetical protein